jgi:hypothetical protein
MCGHIAFLVVVTLLQGLRKGRNEENLEKGRKEGKKE